MLNFLEYTFILEIHIIVPVTFMLFSYNTPELDENFSNFINHLKCL